MGKGGEWKGGEAGGGGWPSFEGPPRGPRDEMFLTMELWSSLDRSIPTANTRIPSSSFLRNATNRCSHAGSQQRLRQKTTTGFNARQKPQKPQDPGPIPALSGNAAQTGKGVLK